MGHGRSRRFVTVDGSTVDFLQKQPPGVSTYEECSECSATDGGGTASPDPADHVDEDKVNVMTAGKASAGRRRSSGSQIVAEYPEESCGAGRKPSCCALQ